jgi:hypothetical protein
VPVDFTRFGQTGPLVHFGSGERRELVALGM